MTLLNRICLLLTFFALTVWQFNFAEAQNYRVYTRVMHSSSQSQDKKPDVIARSLTIWHAGKAYDWIDSVGELVIYDPIQRRYTLLSGPHKLGCTIEFGELRNYLKVARAKAKEYMTDVSESDAPNAGQEIEKIQFQLDPDFQVSTVDNEQNISFDAPVLAYHVESTEAPNQDVAAAFQKYADWAAQLNYILHSQSLLPAPRMEVNRELRERQRLPVRVKLYLKDDFETVLTAEHTIQWKLGPQDRSRIQDWQALMRDPQIQFVSFQEYQTAMLKN